ncbi:acyl carrier protein [Amycolatopsis nigrescens]|uniref:acyl carrier protein n=1 Tax=Amycolatopsis nigrescens TaxID=381445 RepID=UPI0003AA559B|nr:acyl carrier protein [Amycolatopsis nigrescens]
MAEFTTDDLRRIIRATVGVDDSVDLDGDILDVPFTDLGYDSLAVLEVANKIEKELAVSVPDGAVGDMETPRDTIDYVNRQLSTAV